MKLEDTNAMLREMADAGTSALWLEDEAGQVVPARDLMQWARAFQTQLPIARLLMHDGGGVRELVTGFLGVDRRIAVAGGFVPDCPPLVYGTALYRMGDTARSVALGGREELLAEWLYPSRRAAAAGHTRVRQQLSEGTPLDEIRAEPEDKP